MERFNLQKLNHGEVKDQYQDKISNRCVALENWIMMWTPVGLGKVLERIRRLKPQKF
jgi:hypothetical protein